MKKLKVLTALLAALVFVFAVGCDSSGDDVASSSGTSHTYESGTDGLVKDVYHVYTAAGLKEYHDMTLNDTTLSCTLHACIDMSELEDFSWIAVGENISSDYYTGTFDGGGHIVSNPNIRGAFASFFLAIDKGGEVKNLELENVNVTGVAGGEGVGGIAAYNNGTITACWFSGSVSGEEFIGGIVGFNDDSGTITGCYSTGTITGTNYVGGVAGASEGVVTACYWSGNVTGDAGVDYGTGTATKVSGSVTWLTAQSAMNSAISSSGWQYTGATATIPPTLTER